MLLEDFDSAETLLSTQKSHAKKVAVYGYKGFDKDLICRKHQFVMGEVYKKPEKPSVKICSSDGFHYCNHLADVFTHYSRDGKNRFCIIEAVGNVIDVNAEKKSITTGIKVVRELTSEEIDNILYEDAVNLREVKRIQEMNPMSHVGGSTALLLHGIKLSRIIKLGQYNSSDIDMCSPFYFPIQGAATDIIEVLEEDERSDQADFKEVVSFNGIPIDYRIDPRERFEIIKYNGFDYKVTLLEIIMEAKFRYALKGSLKHKEDCYEICGKTKVVNKKTFIVDDDINF